MDTTQEAVTPYAQSKLLLLFEVSCHYTISMKPHTNIPAKIRWSNVGSMLGRRRRRWANIEPTLGERLVFAWIQYLQSQKAVTTYL